MQLVKGIDSSEDVLISKLCNVCLISNQLMDQMWKENHHAPEVIAPSKAQCWEILNLRFTNCFLSEGQPRSSIELVMLISYSPASSIAREDAIEPADMFKDGASKKSKFTYSPALTLSKIRFGIVG